MREHPSPPSPSPWCLSPILSLFSFPPGKPEPLVFHIPQAFFEALQQRISSGSTKKRLPNSTTGKRGTHSHVGNAVQAGGGKNPSSNNKILPPPCCPEQRTQDLCEQGLG